LRLAKVYLADRYAKRVLSTFHRALLRSAQVTATKMAKPWFNQVVQSSAGLFRGFVDVVIISHINASPVLKELNACDHMNFKGRCIS